MSLIYSCSHCGGVVGELNQQSIDTRQLGWDTLSSEEQREMIQQKDNGDIYVQTICENCQESLEQNPTYHELDNFIQ